MRTNSDDTLINSVSKVDVIEKLELLEASPAHMTEPFYRGSSPRWTNNYISFVEHHLDYLKAHPDLDPNQYISNLNLKLRKTPR